MAGLLALAVLFSCLIASTIAQSAGGVALDGEARRLTGLL